MYKRKIQSMLKKQLGFEYICDISAGKFSDVVLYEMPSGDITAGKIVYGERVQQNEIQFWPLLENKNIVKLTKTILMPEINACCFLMAREYRTLEHIVRSGWFQDDENGIYDIKRWLLDILTGTEYLHRHNMCHLNIEANTILISYDSTAKLGGLRLISSSTQPISECGLDFPYYPPELCYSRGENVLVDPVGVDLWSLGVLTLRIFTNNILKVELGNNRSPWSKDVYKTMLREIKQLEWHIEYLFPEMDPSELDLKRLKNFIKMFLSLNPEDRPSAEQAKMHRFLCSGLYMPMPDAVWKKKASSVTIEMTVEKHNTLENVRRRCEERAATNNMLSLRPRDNHQFIHLSESSDDNLLVENLDNNSKINDVKIENLHKIEGTSLVQHPADEIIEGERAETIVLEDCITSVSLGNFKESRSGAKDRVIQRAPEGYDPEKPGSGEKKKKSGFFSRTKSWILQKFRTRKKL